jgi:ABC-type multidrug transport system ATPase subunit
MWQNPHVLILDEPTNYLDREGLGALVLAIKDYNGGVLIISHNKEFCDGVATEKWIMKGGRLRIEGESVGVDEDAGAAGNKSQDDVYDAAGNKIDVKKNVALSEKDKKKAIKDLEKKLKDGKKKKTLNEEEIWELEDKLNELQENGWKYQVSLLRGLTGKRSTPNNGLSNFQRDAQDQSAKQRKQRQKNAHTQTAPAPAAPKKLLQPLPLHPMCELISQSRTP